MVREKQGFKTGNNIPVTKLVIKIEMKYYIYIYQRLCDIDKGSHDIDIANLGTNRWTYDPISNCIDFCILHLFLVNYKRLKGAEEIKEFVQNFGPESTFFYTLKLSMKFKNF